MAFLTVLEHSKTRRDDSARADVEREREQHRQSISEMQRAYQRDVDKAYQQGIRETQREAHNAVSQAKHAMLRQLGDAAVGREEEELESVKVMVKDLEDRRYRAPQKQVLCSEEKEKCLECYKQLGKGESPLVCREVVAAYQVCASASVQGGSFKAVR